MTADSGSCLLEQQWACPQEDALIQAPVADWIKLALQASTPQPVTLGLRWATAAEIQTLNHDYRQRNQPTNILAFAYDGPQVDPNLHCLGDLVVCPEVLHREADEQHKTVLQHLAHLLIHGTLHLQGFDHNDSTSRAAMETLEITLLKQLKLPNPYLYP